MKAKATFALVLITFVWGLTFPVQKMVFFNASPFLYNFVRFAIASALSLPIFGLGNMKYGGALGLVLAAAYSLQSFGLSITSSSKSGFITSLYVVIVPLFAHFLDGERISKRELLAFGLGVVGLYLVTGGIGEVNVGDLMTVLCAVSFALHVVLITKFSRIIPERELMFPQFLIVSLVNLFLNVFFDWKVNYPLLFTASFTAIFATVVAVYVQARYQKILGSNRSALVFMSEPVFAFFLSMMLLGERPATLQVFGAILMLASLALGSSAEKTVISPAHRPPRSPDP